MDIHLNGEPRRIDANTTLGALLQVEGLAGRRVAIELNGEIVPRGEHDVRELHKGDRVEIVHALGGG
jgi:sulfur carrier protein